MKTATIFIKNNTEAAIATAKYLDTCLLEETIKKLKKAEVDKIYLVGLDKDYDDVTIKKNIEEVIETIEGHSGKSLLVSPLYPNIKEYHYQALLNEDTGVVLCNNNEIIHAFMIENRYFADFENIKYKALNVEDSCKRKINSLEELQAYAKDVRMNINRKHLNNGVVIMDIEDTYIGKDVVIGKGTTIYPNVYIEGETRIGEGCSITPASHLINATIGNNTKIIASRIDSSTVGNNVSIGPNSHLRGNSQVDDNVRIGNFVEFKNTKFGMGSKCAHLTYLGDSTIGKNVNIGCGVVTVNYDGVHKFPTVIKDNAFIGSNANIIAPVTVGEYAVIAAGSTVTEDVPDRDMAIARARQINKEGYGYKYIKKEK